MILLTWILGGLVIIAVAIIIVDRLMMKLSQCGGFTIRIEVKDE